MIIDRLPRSCGEGLRSPGRLARLRHVRCVWYAQCIKVHSYIFSDNIQYNSVTVLWSCCYDICVSSIATRAVPRGTTNSISAVVFG